MSIGIDLWKRRSSKIVSDCRVFRVREDQSVCESDGKNGTFFVIESPDWVNIIALTDKKEMILIEQFRHGADEVVLEIPGGMIDPGERPEDAAGRELLEETGYSAGELILLGKSLPNPAIQNNTIFHFLAVGCRKTHSTAFDEHESIAVKLVAIPEAERLVQNGKITHSLVLAAFYFFRANTEYYENFTV